MKYLLLLLILVVTSSFAGGPSEECSIYGRLAGVTMMHKNKARCHDSEDVQKCQEQSRQYVTSSLREFLQGEQHSEQLITKLVEFVGRVHDTEVDMLPRHADEKYFFECFDRFIKERDREPNKSK